MDKRKKQKGDFDMDAIETKGLSKDYGHGRGIFDVKQTLEVCVMSKKNFVTLILSTVGGILFAIGMCMCLLPEWNAFAQGVVIAAVGAVILLIMVIVRRKMEGKPVIVKLSGKTIGSILLGIVGALALGVGMCMVMVWEMLIQGILVGVVGIVLLLCLIPLIKGLK